MAKLKKDKTVLLGVVGVDSGQLVITDPGYIGSKFQQPKEGEDDNFSTHTIYQHKTTKKLYQFCYRHHEMDTKPAVADVIPFPGSYADPIPEYKKSPNVLIESGDFVATKIDPTPHVKKGEFSYNGICKVTQNSKDQGGQLNYRLGHPGVAVAFVSGLGDGTYKVYADIVDTNIMGERIKKIWVELISDKELAALRKG